MTRTFVKARAGTPRGVLRWEAAGLAWLASARALPVVRVLEVDDDRLVLDRLVPAPPSPTAAADLGRGLARLHAAGAPSFGAGPAGWSGDGWFGPLDDPRPMRLTPRRTWGEHYAENRVLPLRDALAPDDPGTGHALDRLAERVRDGTWDDDEGPARLHGDLWSGNVVWTTRGATLVDPAAHGGHRLTDLAMLELFGLPHLDTVLRAYDEVHALRADRAEVVALHQVYPVGMHAVLFGGGYHAQLEGLLRRLL